MPKLNLRDARRIKTAAGELRAIKLPGGHVWHRRVIADLYGTGPGRIPLHLTPRDAIMAGANLSSIPNRGGAGAAFNASAGPTAITRSGNLLNLPGPNSYLELANPADLMGTRMFIVAQRADTANRRLASMEAGTAGDGDTNNDRMVLIYGGVKMPNGENASRMVIGTGFNAPYSNGPFPILTTLALYELQLTGTTLTILLNGVQYASGQALPAGTGAFQIKRLFASQVADVTNWKGAAGDVVSLITDGSHAREIDTIRRELADLHGITLGQVLGGASGK